MRAAVTEFWSDAFWVLLGILTAAGGVGLFITTRPGNRRTKAEHERVLSELRCQSCGAPWKGYPLCTSCKRRVEVPQLPRDVAPWLAVASFLPLVIILFRL